MLVVTVSMVLYFNLLTGRHVASLKLSSIPGAVGIDNKCATVESVDEAGAEKLTQIEVGCVLYAVW